jgi:nucleoside-diphosphate-sugar epimerase
VTQRAVLVTGAGGFLGRHLLQAMATDGAEWAPLALVSDVSAWHRLEWTGRLPSVSAIAGRLADSDRWPGTLQFSNVSTIVHLAAVVQHHRADADEMIRTNVDGTLAMVRLAARLRCRLVYLSTSGTVGCFRTPTEWADEDSPFCTERVERWPYYASKIAAEQAASELADNLGVELVTLRPPVMLGPDDHRGRSTATVRRVLTRKVPVLFAGGMHFVDIRDVATAILTVIRKENPRRVYHLAGTESTMSDYFHRIAELSGVPLRAPTVPAAALHLAATINARLGRFGVSVLPDPVVIEMASHYWGLRSRFASELRFIPRPGDVTLRDTIEWLRRVG